MRAVDIFLQPSAWPVVLVAPLAAFGLWFAARSRAGAMRRVLGPRAAALAAGDGRRARTLHGVLLVVGLLASGLAVMQPAWGEGESRAQQRGVDVLVCLDVSRSMLARDQAPSRLLAAQRAIVELAERARGDRLGLVVFAGEARLAVPLTRDVDTFKTMARVQDPLSVSRGGTDLGAALDTAASALAGASGDHEVILLLTDGEDNEGGGLRAAQRCVRRGITVHSVGFGSRRGGKIPVQGDGGEVFLRDGTGEEVVTAADTVALERLADATGGVFVLSVDTPRALVELYDAEITPMARKAFGERERQERENRFQWPLGAALACFLLSFCVPQLVSSRGGRR